MKTQKDKMAKTATTEVEVKVGGASALLFTCRNQARSQKKKRKKKKSAAFVAGAHQTRGGVWVRFVKEKVK